MVTGRRVTAQPAILLGRELLFQGSPCLLLQSAGRSDGCRAGSPVPVQQCQAHSSGAEEAEGVACESTHPSIAYIIYKAHLHTIQAEMVEAHSKEDSTPTNFAHLHNQQEQNGTTTSASGESSSASQPKRVYFPPNPLPQHQLYTNPANLNRSISEIHPSPQLNKSQQPGQEEAEEGGGESRLRVSSFSTAKTPTSSTRVEQNGTTPSASEVRKRRRSDGVDGISFKRPRLVPDITETAADDDQLLPSSAKESVPSESGFSRSSFSNASWKETVLPLIVGCHPHKLVPLSIEMEQRLILHYLIPTCEYQDNLSIVLESR